MAAFLIDLLLKQQIKSAPTSLELGIYESYRFLSLDKDLIICRSLDLTYGHEDLVAASSGLGRVLGL